MITTKAIRPVPFDDKAFAREFRKAADLMGFEILREFKKTIATWHNRPQFKNPVTQNNDETKVEVYVEGKTPPGVQPKTPEDIYIMLTVGTEKRYAVMEKGFQPKTAVGVIDSFPGSGGFSHLDMDEGRAMARAIQARQWDIVIKEDKERRMKPIFESALGSAVVLSGHRYA